MGPMGKLRGKQSRYTDEQKAQALLMVQASADKRSPIAFVSHVLGIPRRTLTHWVEQTAALRQPTQADRRMAALADEMRPALADKCEELAHRFFDTIDPREPRMNALQLMTAAGIAVDKMRLLRGEPTQITERVGSDVAGAITAEDIRALVSAIERRLAAGQGAKALPGNTVVDGKVTQAAEGES